MSKTATVVRQQDDIDLDEQRRTDLILDFRNIGVFFDEDTPLDEIPRVDQVTKLRMLATKHRRPIAHLLGSPDEVLARWAQNAGFSDVTPENLKEHTFGQGPNTITYKWLIARELDRLMMLEGGTRRRGSYKTIKVEPCPANFTAAEKRARALEGKQIRDGRYATGRFSETVGYGSHSSYSVQVADARSMGAEPLITPATPSQLDYIRSLSKQKRIPLAQLPTRFDLAQELLDELIAAPARPTKPMAKFLSDLQTQLGLELKPAASFDDCRAELDRLVAIRNSKRS